jgi:hypothetical protein
MIGKQHRALIGVSICLLVIGLWFLSVRGIAIEGYRDNKVTAGEMRRAWDVIAVHASRPQYLTVGGKTFRGIRGLAPYYLDVPGTNAIFFVTQEGGYRVKFHFFNLAPKKDIGIDGGGSGFGWGIGGSRKPGEEYTDYITGMESNRITIVINSGDWMETMVLNLATKAIERRETLRFNASGDMTNRSVKTFLKEAGQ